MGAIFLACCLVLIGFTELASFSYGISQSWSGGVLFWGSSLLWLVVVLQLLRIIVMELQYFVVSSICMMIIVGMLSTGITNINLLISVFMFNFCGFLRTFFDSNSSNNRQKAHFPL